MRVVVQFGQKNSIQPLFLKYIMKLPKTIVLKPIINVLDHQPIISNQQFKLWEWIANYYCCSLGDVMHSALPSVLKLSSETKLKITENELIKAA